MNTAETVLQVAAAALSVIGFYGILHALLEALLTPRELAAAVILTKYVPPEELDILLCEARRAPFGGNRRVVLVVPVSLLDGVMGEGGALTEAYAEVLERYEAVFGVCAPEAER